MIERLKLNNRGVMSILSIIIVVIIVIAASGFITIMERTMAISEVQGIMDTAGLMSLRQGVDKDLFRMEVIEIDTFETTSQFRTTLRKNLDKMNSIKDYEIRTVRVHSPDSSSLKSLGIPDGERGQYYLESLVVVYMTRSSEFGPSDSTIWKFYDFFSGADEEKQKEVSIEKVDGKDALVIRSVTRLVLR